jgi:uncharacterized membrane protein
MMRIKNITNQQLVIAVILMVVVGIELRFYNLTFKMIWADEIASIVHGLGNSFSSIPSDKIITLSDLLKPLNIEKDSGIIEVIKHGIFEDFVPPLYFMLLHLWIFLFKTSDQLVPALTVRSLAAGLSVLSIPGIYFLTKALFPNRRLVILLATALITLSPYSIALAQEVRHYSIAIILVILSMLIFFQITERIIKNNSLTAIQIFLLVGCNLLGIASHYFFVIVIIAEVLTLIVITYQYQMKSAISKISIVASVNFLTVLAWAPVFFLNNSRDDLTVWAQMDITKVDVIINLFLQLIVSSITMIILLPVESSNMLVVITSALIMVSTIAAITWLVASSINYEDNRYYGLSLKFLKTYLFCSMFLLITISCLVKKDFLSSPRYHFVYFPVVIILTSYLISSSFFTNQYWLQFKKVTLKKSLILYLFGLILFTSALSVVNNLSFLKPFHADLMAKIINESSVGNTVIVTTNQNLIDTSHTMALGWQLAHLQNQRVMPRFFLDRFSSGDTGKIADSSIRDTLIQNALQSAKISSLWLINYPSNIDLENCRLQKSDTSLSRSDYKYYSCR